jgi:hypothetical protein
MKHMQRAEHCSPKSDMARTAALALTALMLWPVAIPADELTPYEARYSVYRNGKFTGETTVKLELDGNRWSMHSEARGTRGLARLLKLRNTEHSDGEVTEGKFLPSSYEHHTRAMGIDRRWTAAFDWETRLVQTQTRDGDFSLPLESGTLDPLSLDLALRQVLPEGVVEWQGQMVDEDEIKLHRYRITAAESRDTALGCLNTHRVERLRENSQRYTRAWYASELEYVVVRLEHGKYEGDSMEMRIESLVVGDETHEPGSPCEIIP